MKENKILVSVNDLDFEIHEVKMFNKYGTFDQNFEDDDVRCRLHIFAL
jgi:hypothetical protein